MKVPPEGPERAPLLTFKEKVFYTVWFGSLLLVLLLVAVHTQFIGAYLLFFCWLVLWSYLLYGVFQL
jgi:hypothetical protein